MLTFVAQLLMPVIAVAIYDGAPLKAASFHDSKCATVAGDRFDSEMRISSKSKLHPLECVDGTRFRPVQLLGYSSVNGRAGELRIANLKVDDKYWIGVIHGNSWVDQVIFQIEDFSAGNPFLDKFITPAHTMMRLVLKDSARIDLYDQTNPDGPVVKKAAVKNLNISIDAAMTVHGEYDFLQEMDPVYPISVSFLAARDRVREQYFTESPKEFRPIEQFNLTLSQDEKDAVLFTALNYGQKLQLNYFYNTLNFNCVTEAFTVFDRAIMLRRLKVPPFKVSYSPDPVRGPALKALKARKMLDPKTLPNLSEETRDGQIILP